MQRFLRDNYILIVEICKGLTPEYMDLAHDFIVKSEHREFKCLDGQERFYLSVVCYNFFLNWVRKKGNDPHLFCDITQREEDNEEPLPDPYDYYKRIEKADLDEFERLWLEIYLDHNGNYKEISRNINLTRQTISKHIRRVCRKLQESH